MGQLNRGVQDVLVALPENEKDRKGVPITTGVLDYFPAAIAELARVSKAGNDQHNPGRPLHWARGKSADHADCIARHLIQRGTRDTDGQRHTAKMAWRALALLQEEIEAEAGFVPGARRGSMDADTLRAVESALTRAAHAVHEEMVEYGESIAQQAYHAVKTVHREYVRGAIDAAPGATAEVAEDVTTASPDCVVCGRPMRRGGQYAWECYGGTERGQGHPLVYRRDDAALTLVASADQADGFRE